MLALHDDVVRCVPRRGDAAADPGCHGGTAAASSIVPFRHTIAEHNTGDRVPEAHEHLAKGSRVTVPSSAVDGDPETTAFAGPENHLDGTWMVPWQRRFPGS